MLFPTHSKEADGQRGGETCPRSHSWHVAELGLYLGQTALPTLPSTSFPSSSWLRG